MNRAGHQERMGGGKGGRERKVKGGRRGVKEIGGDGGGSEGRR